MNSPLKPIEINFKGMIINWLGRQLAKDAGMATKADLPPQVRAGPDVIIRSESTPADRIANYARYSETQFIWLAMQNPWAFSNARILAHIVAEGELKVQVRNTESREKWEEVDAHPFELILEGRPNPWMSQYYVWLYQVIWYLMKGEAYWMIVRNDLGEVLEMYPLPASRVLPIPGEGDEMYAGFAYTPIVGATPKLLLPEDICYHRFPNIFQYFRGWSNLNAYLLGLKIDREAAEFDLRDYELGLELKQIISFRPDLDDTEFATALMDLINAQEDGLRFMGIRGGDMDVANVTQRRADSGGDIRQRMASEAGRIFGVFDGFWDKSANRASSERAEQNTVAYGAWPIMRMFSEDLTAQIIIPTYGIEYRVTFDDIRPRNIELDIKEEEHEWSAMTWDQVQEEKGREPHPDPDVGGAPYKSAGRIAEMKAVQGSLITERNPNPSLPIEAGLTAFSDDSEENGTLDTDEAETLRIAGILRKMGNGAYSPGVGEMLLRAEGIQELRDLDLKKWKTVSIRMLDKGNRPEAYTFYSDHISKDEVKYIRAMLTRCETIEDVKDLFNIQGDPFIPDGTEGYAPEDETEEEIATLAEEDVEEFSQEFDELMPELGTLLEAEEEEIE
jgi:hypothetical protein